MLADGFRRRSLAEDVHDARPRRGAVGRLRFLKADIVIIIANAVSLILLAGNLSFKLRERSRPGTLARSASKAS